MTQERIVTEAVLEARIAPSIQRAMEAVEALAGAVRELASAFRPVDTAAGRTEGSIEQVGRAGQVAGRQAAQGVRRLRDSLREAGREASGLRAALVGVAAAGVGIQQGREFEQFQQFRIEAPQLDTDEALRAFSAAQRLGIDEGRLSALIKDTGERVGEGNEEVIRALEELGTTREEVLNLQGFFQRERFLIERLAEADADRRVFLADTLFGGEGGELAARAAFDPEFHARLTTELERESTLTAEQAENWRRSQQAIASITTSISEATRVLIGAFAPALEAVAGFLEDNPVIAQIGAVVAAIGGLIAAFSSFVGPVLLLLKAVGGISIAAPFAAALAPIAAVAAAIAGIVIAIVNVHNRFRELQENWEGGLRNMARALIEFLVNILTVPGILTSLARDVGLIDYNLGEQVGNVLVPEEVRGQAAVVREPVPAPEVEGRQTGGGVSNFITNIFNIDRIEEVEDIQRHQQREIDRQGG